MGSTVQIASSDEERQEIYRLRYDVYIEEMRGQGRHAEADVEKRQLYDEWDERAHHFYICQDKQMVACARLIHRSQGPFECESEFDLHHFAPFFPESITMTSRMAVHSTLRGSHLLKQLAIAMFVFARQRQIALDFIDCHPRLLPLYSRLGYRLYRPGFNHPKYTYVVPMVMALEDREYLERIRSPLAPIAQQLPSSTAATELLLSCFPEFAVDSRSGVCDSEEFWDVLKQRLLGCSFAARACDILSGLAEEEIKIVTNVGHVISCRQGDVVLNRDDTSREVCVILSGRFEVTGRVKGPTGEMQILKVLEPGESFGEIRFLTEHIRYATVTAVEDATLLVLSARALDRLGATCPIAGAKLYRNLAALVAARLASVAL